MQLEREVLRILIEDSWYYLLHIRNPPRNHPREETAAQESKSSTQQDLHRPCSRLGLRTLTLSFSSLATTMVDFILRSPQLCFSILFPPHLPAASKSKSIPNRRRSHSKLTKDDQDDNASALHRKRKSDYRNSRTHLPQPPSLLQRLLSAQTGMVHGKHFNKHQEADVKGSLPYQAPLD